MFSFLISAYVTIITVLFILDVKNGLSDAAQRKPAVRSGLQILGASIKQLFEGFVHARRERARLAYATCTHDRGDALVSGAGKAIAMK